MGVTYDVMRVAAIDTAAHRLGGPRDLFSGSRELSSQRSVPPLSGNVDDLITSDRSTVLDDDLLLSVSRRFLGGFDDQGRGRRHHLGLGLSVLSGQVHCDPQSLPIAGCFGDVITNHVLETGPGGRSWALERTWHRLPC